jgi:hypothetical protein
VVAGLSSSACPPESPESPSRSPLASFAGTWRRRLVHGVVLLAWCGAALTAAGPAAEDDGQEDGEPEDDGPPLDDAAFVELVHDVARGGNVHLNAIRERLAEELPDYEWTAPDVTALCETAGIPTRKGVRVPGATPTSHRSPPPLPTRPLLAL